MAKILEKLILSQVSSYLNSHNLYNTCQSLIEHIGRLARMSDLDTEVDGSNPGSSMLFP